MSLVGKFDGKELIRRIESALAQVPQPINASRDGDEEFFLPRLKWAQEIPSNPKARRRLLIRAFFWMYLNFVCEQPFYKNLARILPGFGWRKTEKGFWYATKIPNLLHLQPETHEVYSPNEWVEEEGELVPVEESDGADPDLIEFTPSEIWACPFGYEVYWEPEFGDYEYPNISTEVEFDPFLNDPLKHPVSMNSFLRKLRLPIPRIRVMSARSVADQKLTEWSIDMQIQMQAIGRKNVSLRRLITQNLDDQGHPVLLVKEGKSKKRARGWAKITGKGCPGALNLEWDADQKMLLVRAIARKGNTPHELLGEFLSYLIDRYGKKIGSINVQLR